jgi:hypothetical protein
MIMNRIYFREIYEMIIVNEQQATNFHHKLIVWDPP